MSEIKTISEFKKNITVGKTGNTGMPEKTQAITTPINQETLGAALAGNNSNQNNNLTIKPKEKPLTKEQKQEIAKKFREELAKTKEKQSWIGKSWNWFKNKTTIGLGSDKVDDLITKFENGDISAKDVQEKLKEFNDGQNMCVDVFADIVSGVAAVGIYTAAVAAAPFSGGASIAVGVAAAAASSAAIKTGIKFADAKAAGKEYSLKDAGIDAATGSVNGLLAPITGGVGGAVGKTVATKIGVSAVQESAKMAIKETAMVGAKTGVKAAITKGLFNPTGYKYVGGTALKRGLAFGAECATDGALGGSLDNMFRASINGENILEAGASGFVGGLVMAPVIGGGFKLAGKGANKILGKNADNISVKGIGFDKNGNIKNQKYKVNNSEVNITQNNDVGSKYTLKNNSSENITISLKSKELVEWENSVKEKFEKTYPSWNIRNYLKDYSLAQIDRALNLQKIYPEMEGYYLGGILGNLNLFEKCAKTYSRLSNELEMLDYTKLPRWYDISWYFMFSPDEQAKWIDFIKNTGIASHELNELDGIKIKKFIDDIKAKTKGKREKLETLKEILINGDSIIDGKGINFDVEFKNSKIKGEYLDFAMNLDEKIMSPDSIRYLIQTPLPEIKEGYEFWKNLSPEAQSRWDLKWATQFKKYKNIENIDDLSLIQKQQLIEDLRMATDHTLERKLYNEIKILPKNIDEWVDVMNKLTKDVQPVSKNLSSVEISNNKKLFNNILSNSEKTDKAIDELIEKTNISNVSLNNIKNKFKNILKKDSFRKLTPNEQKLMCLAIILSESSKNSLELVHKVKNFGLSSIEFQQLYSILENKNLIAKIEDVLVNSSKKDIQLTFGESDIIFYDSAKIKSELLIGNSFEMALLLSDNSPKLGKVTIDKINQMKNEIDNYHHNTRNIYHVDTILNYQKSENIKIKGYEVKVVRKSDISDFQGFIHTTVAEIGTNGGGNGSGGGFCPNPIFGKSLDNKMKTNIIRTFQNITNNNIFSVAATDKIPFEKFEGFLLKVNADNCFSAGCGGSRRGNKVWKMATGNENIIYSEHKKFFMEEGNVDSGERLVNNPDIIAIFSGKSSIEEVGEEYLKIASELNIPIILN